MTYTPETFEAAITAWQQWQESPRGRLRFTLAEANLNRHIQPRSRVLDLAGADGGDAIRLAAQGHDVTIVDFAPAMLAAARQRAEAAGVHITLIEADAMDLPGDIGDYDVVVCHNLLQYHADSAPALRAARNVLRPNGLMSVMAVNRYSTTLVESIRENDLAAAQAALTTVSAHKDIFGTVIISHAVEEIAAVLDNLGCPVRAHYGIRSVSDYIADDGKREPEFYAELEQLELALTDRHPYMHTARIFQLVASSR